MSERGRDHNEFQADLAAYALRTLDAASAASLEEHLRSCPECRELLAGYEEVVAGYPLAIETQAPPDGSLDRLLERARHDAAELPAIAAPPNPGWRMRYLWTGFAAMAALLLVMLGWNVWLQFNASNRSLVDSERIAIVLPLDGSASAESATGQLVMDAEWDDCALVASGLPPLGAESDYQLWFVRADGSRESGAVFHPNARGQVTVDVDVPDNWRDFERVGVTEEPAGGSPGPTGPSVLGGNFASSD